MDKKTGTRKPHIFEIDLIRAITVFTVVAVHSLSYTTYLTTKTAALELLNLIGHSLHYNRETFMFVTGLVLTYVYYHREFSVKKFWMKRTLLVFIPYVLWTIIYTLINNASMTPLTYFVLILKNTITGGASFQLYYILLALQFYALFPYFLFLLKKVANHPWIVLSISLALQLIFLFFDYYFLQLGHISATPVVKLITDAQDKVIFTYQFYFVLGAFAAVYMEQATAFLKRFGRYLPVLFVAGLGLYGAYYYMQLHTFHETIGQATSVLQPSVALYSIVIIPFFSWIAMLWAKKRYAYKLVSIISDTSFGIYFVHVLVLSFIAAFILPIMSHMLPVPLTDITVLLMAFSVSVAFCYLLLKMPLLSWTIGRAQPLQSPFTRVRHLAKKTYAQKRHLRRVFAWLSIFVLILVLAVFVKAVSFSNISPPMVPRHHRISAVPENPDYTLPRLPPQNSSIVYDQPVRSTGCGVVIPDEKSGTTMTLGVTSDGLNRTYRLYLPEGYSNTSMHPLLLNFHGYASDAQEQERVSRFDKLANTYNFIVVYPQGTTGTNGVAGWNTGLHADISANDILFTSNMLNAIQSNLCIDPDRIYATGFSNGGGFVDILTCKMANRIAAFAPVSGSYLREPPHCGKERPISIIEFHGTADRIVPYNGSKRHGEYSVLSWIKTLAKANDCAGTSKVFYNTKRVVGYTVTKCDTNASIVHYKLVGAHHVWPTELFRTTIDGDKREVNVADVIWTFFAKHPMGKASS